MQTTDAVARRELDARRRRAFLQREADRIISRRKRIQKQTNVGEKERLLREHQEEVDALKKSVGHRPGSKAHLEEIWQKEDGLIGMQFSPQTFFRLHDTNGDDIFDLKEIDALMSLEANSLHSHTDALAAHEEAARLREAMLKDYDSDNNGVIGQVSSATHNESGVLSC